LKRNILTVDVEEWHHVCCCGKSFPYPSPESQRVRRNLHKILSLLEEHEQKATFFMLGAVAEKNADLAPMIVSGGHEIASHGYSHRLVTELTPEEFEEELEATERIILRQTGLRPFGYRAPQWSMPKSAEWAFAILRDRGYYYDSSLNPLLFVGENGWSCTPYDIPAGEGVIREFPPMVTKNRLLNLPTGGGWGFRLFPMGIICGTIDAINRSGLPAMLYLHPREVDPEGPRMELPLIKRFVSYGTRDDLTPRLKTVLEKYHFTTVMEIMNIDGMHTDSGI